MIMACVVLESRTRDAAATYQEKNEKYYSRVVWPFLRSPESTARAWSLVAPPYIWHWSLHAKGYDDNDEKVL